MLENVSRRRYMMNIMTIVVEVFSMEEKIDNKHDDDGSNDFPERR